MSTTGKNCAVHYDTLILNADSCSCYRCGNCVGGSTGLQDAEGRDTCNVCYGSDECVKCKDQANEGNIRRVLRLQKM